MAEQGTTPAETGTSRPHPARMYDYFLGGSDNHDADREAAQQVIDLFPDIVPTVKANRAFLRRAVRYMVDSGVRQIIDIGTGIPTSPNTHEVARETAPGVRVAYVDNDPVVARQADAHLLPDGSTRFVLADLRDPEAVLGHPAVRELIDLDRPVGLMLLAVLHFVPDDGDPAALVAAYRDALPAGSHLVLSHATADFHPPETGVDEARDVYRERRATATVTTRTYERILGFFGDFELVDPGLVQPPLWRPDQPLPSALELARIGCYAGIGAKL